MRAIERDLDDRAVVDAAQRDPSHFAVLYEQNFDRVYAYVARRVASREEAEDVTAETFHQALASLAKFEWRDTPFIAWLLGIAANVIAARWRQTSTGHEIATDALPDIGAEDEIERRTMLAHLVEELPADQKSVVMLRFIDQLSIREIAKRLGRSEGAIKQLQFRALQALRARVRGSHV